MTASSGLVATYQLTLAAAEFSDERIAKTAEQIAVGQTVGTFNAYDMPELQPFIAQVIAVRPHTGQVDGDILSEFDIAFPEALLTSDLGMLISVIFGKVSMMGRLRLMNLNFSESLAQRYGGPRFGVAGIRKQVGEPKAPLLKGIFKPCVGLSAETLGEMFYTQSLTGLHLIMDDEILSDISLDSARRRLEACLKAGERAEAEGGRKLIYSLNLTGPADQLIERARILAKDGARAFLFNYVIYGLPMLNALRQDPEIQVPLVAHPALAGAMYQTPYHGVHPRVILGQLPRLAGADLVLLPSPYGSVNLPKSDALAVHQALNEPHTGLKQSFSTPSAGIKPAMVPQFIEDFGMDVIINAGTGIYDHPDGALAGGKLFRDTLDGELEKLSSTAGQR